jgi:transposase InsO family protein
MYYGPEYISHQLQKWAHEKGIAILYIQPGKPQQNAYIERFNRTVRYDWLNQHLSKRCKKKPLNGYGIITMKGLIWRSAE